MHRTLLAAAFLLSASAPAFASAPGAIASQGQTRLQQTAEIAIPPRHVELAAAKITVKVHTKAGKAIMHPNDWAIPPAHNN